MIIKILSSTGTFAAVKYNTNKIDTGDGELMKVANIRHCENDLSISPSEVKDYLKAHSSTNSRIKNSQFHAVISANGQQLDKFQLTDIAEKYLEKMGYGSNPYIVVFHKDTENNHVHIVTSRVDDNGNKIDNNNERLRSLLIRKELMEDYGIKNDKDINKLLSYHVQSEKQLLTLLKNEGFKISDHDAYFDIYYNGELKRKLLKSEINLSEIDKHRTRQLKGIIEKYSKEYDTALVPIFEKRAGERLGNITGYTSDLSDFLKSKFGIEFHYHFSGDKKPFGYTVFDHSKKNVFKGSDIVKLGLILDIKTTSQQKERQTKTSKLLEKVSSYNISKLDYLQVLSKYYKIPEYQLSTNDRSLTEQEKNYYSVLLDFHFKNGNWENLNKLGITAIKHNGDLLLLDKGNLTIIEAKDFIPKDVLESYSMNTFEHNQNHEQSHDNVFDWGWDIADDVDDERVFGNQRSKGRKRK